MGSYAPNSTSRTAYNYQVFLNVPFDEEYKSIFRALIFAVHDCGYQVRCALESHDGGEVRVDKLYNMIEGCRFSIHDISRTTLDKVNKLPRFNMPLELGLFLGAKRYGGAKQKKKVLMILDAEEFRYQKYCSDIAGQDIRAHENLDVKAIRAVRNWMQLAPDRQGDDLPSWTFMARKYKRFQAKLPEVCKKSKLSLRHLTYADYLTIVVGWLVAEDKRAEQAQRAASLKRRRLA